jgi:hypothetical protein
MDVFDEIYALTRPGNPYCGVSTATFLQRYLEDTGCGEEQQIVPTDIQQQALQCYDPDSFRPFSIEQQSVPVSVLLSAMTGGMFARGVLAVREQAQQQTRQCPGSIALTLKECAVANNRVCYAYCICFVDGDWTRQEHFLGLSPPLHLPLMPPQEQEGGGERQTLATHLAHTLSEVYGLQPSTDISSLQLCCGPSSSSSPTSLSSSSTFIASVGQQLGITLTHTSFLTDLEALCTAALSSPLPNDTSRGSLRESLHRAARLAAHFAPAQPAAELLRGLLCHDDEGGGG